ncbi:MAG TPA: MFS transporter [Azoarcus taiwanensis]|uniref:MFS transporter n=1 Tax=Azoarcus taiwanensis TaxID=666964 RepID=A0A972F921_9RHOO|nr:MFS transporter [Azoarcus taiwanensis]NMG04317.1 MFS transporter [Azoarcus taiwanensis]HRQ56477.1 MFS transporter [Azoarcus taiwanensis]
MAEPAATVASAADAGAADEAESAAAATWRPVFAYGAFGLPLAFAALPIYVHVPRLYVEGFGLSLAAVGAVLLAVRILDALTDPLIGWASDRLANRKLAIALSLPVLGAGMFGLLSPPAGAGAAWMAAMIFFVTLGFSVATINYGAWGAEAAHTANGRTRLVASREGFALLGVVLAASLPTVLAPGDEVAGLARLTWIFLPLLCVGALVTLAATPRPQARRHSMQRVLPSLWAALVHRPFLLLLAVFCANGIAAAIPASTVLFFVADVLQASGLSGLFLVLYFVAGAASLPLWVRLSRCVGKVRAWFGSMLLAIASFIWAYFLGAGDTFAFALICVASGAALGADLALPPAMLADLLARDTSPSDARAGAWFGWWNFVTKANLALAAGLALPLLGMLGYVSGGTDPDGLQALSAVYALAPVALKLLAATLLWSLRYKLDFEGGLK